MEIFREFTFDSAHQLDHLPEGHKCARMHGHTYRLRVYVGGPIQQPVGWVMDFAELKRATNAVLDRLDHRTLNDIPGLEQPTSEAIVQWIWRELKPGVPGLSRLELWENAASGCVYTGD